MNRKISEDPIRVSFGTTAVHASQTKPPLHLDCRSLPPFAAPTPFSDSDFEFAPTKHDSPPSSLPNTYEAGMVSAPGGEALLEDMGMTGYVDYHHPTGGQQEMRLPEVVGDCSFLYHDFDRALAVGEPGCCSVPLSTTSSVQTSGLFANPLADNHPHGYFAPISQQFITATSPMQLAGKAHFVDIAAPEGLLGCRLEDTSTRAQQFSAPHIPNTALDGELVSMEPVPLQQALAQITYWDLSPKAPPGTIAIPPQPSTYPILSSNDYNGHSAHDPSGLKLHLTLSLESSSTNPQNLYSSFSLASGVYSNSGSEIRRSLERYDMPSEAQNVCRMVLDTDRGGEPSGGLLSPLETSSRKNHHKIFRCPTAGSESERGSCVNGSEISESSFPNFLCEPTLSNGDITSQQPELLSPPGLERVPSMETELTSAASTASMSPNIRDEPFEFQDWTVGDSDQLIRDPQVVAHSLPSPLAATVKLDPDVPVSRGLFGPVPQIYISSVDVISSASKEKDHPNTKAYKESLFRRIDLRKPKKMSDQRFSCTKCQTTFKLQRDLDRHFKSVHDRQKHICTLCGKELARKDGLVRHKKLHLREKQKQLAKELHLREKQKELAKDCHLMFPLSRPLIS